MKYFFILFVFICSLLFSCQNKSNTNDLIIGVMSSTDLLPYAIAKKNGYFDRYGVKVDIQKFYSANDRDAAFQSNSIDGTITDLTSAIIQQANGIKAVITSKEFGVFHVIVNDSAINSMADLKGKTVASSKNTVIDFVIDKGLESVGLTSEDITRQEINKIPIRLEMIRNHKTDATALPEPFISMALNEGMKSITNVKELGYNVTCMLFSESAARQKSNSLIAMYKAYNEAVTYISNHSREEYVDVLITDLGVPEHLTGQVILPEYKQALMPSSKDILSVTEWLKNKKLIPQNYTTEKLMNANFISK